MGSGGQPPSALPNQDQSPWEASSLQTCFPGCCLGLKSNSLHPIARSTLPMVSTWHVPSCIFCSQFLCLENFPHMSPSQSRYRPELASVPPEGQSL